MERRWLTVCHDCSLLAPRRLAIPNALRTTARFSSIQKPSPRQQQEYHHRRIAQRRLGYRLQPSASYASLSASSAPRLDLNALHARVQELAASVLSPSDGPVPAEQRVLYVIEQIDAVARSTADANSIAGAVSLNGNSSSATTALLGSVNNRRSKIAVTKALLLSTITQRAEDILRHPNVFITPAILDAYVQLQQLLQQPTSFPDVFELYATKPVPKAGGDGTVAFVQADPRSLKSAIDRKTADAALTAAIKAHDLVLALDIIDTSLAAPSYARAKILRQCALPGVAAALLPVVAYSLSTHFSSWQSMMDPSQATFIAFSGIMTYVAAVGGMGYVALTTANDQMDRITWAPGVPLWERWVREEERAAFDRIASAWGFKGVERRGEEQGEDWETLRETCGRRGMELDRVDLMEGME